MICSATIISQRLVSVAKLNADWIVLVKQQLLCLCTLLFVDMLIAECSWL